MIRYLLIFLFLSSSCSKVLNLKHGEKGRISNNLLSLFKGKNLEELYDALDKESKSNKLGDIYRDDGSNLLMLSLESNFDLKEKEALFVKILLCICEQEKIITNFEEMTINRNPFLNDPKIFKPDEIFSKEFKMNLIEFKSKLKFINLKSLKSLINSFNNQRKTLIFYAFDLGEGIFIDFLIDLADLEFSNNENIRPLVYAICERREVVKYLYNKGYLGKFVLNYNSDFNRHSNDPLIYAVLKGDKEIVNILLLKGCNSNSVDEHGNKAILLAADNDYDEIVSLLLACGGKYLSKEEIVSRKIKKGATKTTAALIQLVSDATFKGAGAPVSLNTSSLTSIIKRSHNLNRTKLYGKVLKIFLKGDWIEIERYSKNTLIKYKNFLGTLKYYLKEAGEKDRDLDQTVKYYDSKIKEFSKRVKYKFEEIGESFKNAEQVLKGKLINIKNLPVRLRKLNKNFGEIQKELLNENLIDLHAEIEKEFLKKPHPKSSESTYNELEIELLSLKKYWIEIVISFQTFLLNHQITDQNTRISSKEKGGYSELKEDTKEDKAYDILIPGILDKLLDKELRLNRNDFEKFGKELINLSKRIADYTLKIELLENKINLIKNSNF